MCLEVFSYSIAGPPELYIGSNTNGSQFTHRVCGVSGPHAPWGFMEGSIKNSIQGLTNLQKYVYFYAQISTFSCKSQILDGHNSFKRSTYSDSKIVGSTDFLFIHFSYVGIFSPSSGADWGQNWQQYTVFGRPNSLK